MKKSSRILFTFTGVIIALILLISAVVTSQSLRDTPLSWYVFKAFGIKEVIGNRKIMSKSVDLTEFDTLTVGGDFDVSINYGNQGKIVLTSDENILPYINVNKSSNHVSIGFRSGIAISPSQTEKAIITAPTLHNITLEGVATLNALNMKTNNLTLTMKGKSVGDIQGDINQTQVNLGGNSILHLKLNNAENIKLNIAGISKVFLAGNTKNLIIVTSGKATIQANDLIADNVEITGKGVSDIVVHALKTLSVATSGKSDIKYSGNPVIKRKSSGVVSIEKSNDASN
jgi:hypothetical protein